MGLDLKASVSLDGSGFEAGLKRIEGAVHSVGETLKGLALGAVGFYGIEHAIEGTIEKAEKLANTALRLGMNVEALQELSFAAEQTGSDLESLTGFIEKLNANRLDPSKLGAFARFGVTNPASGDVGDILKTISANVQGKNPQEFFRDLKEIGGKGVGREVLLLIESLDELAKKAHEAGVIISTEDIAALKLAADEMKVLAQILTADLAPAIAFAVRELLHFVHAVQSTGSFYGNLSDSLTGQDIKAIIAAAIKYSGGALGPLLSNPEELDSFRKKFTAAGAKSETELNELNQKTDALLDALIDRLNHPPKPNFESPPSDDFSAKAAKPYTDSLLRVGNFLGGTDSPMISIGRTQIEYLRQIAHNTSQTSSQSNDQDFPVP